MFRSLLQDHLQGSSLVLSAYHVFASHFVICLYWYVVLCPLFVFVPPVPACVLSCCELTTRQHTGRYRWYKYRGHKTTYQCRHMTK
jgi:hypothetical protein